MSDGAPFAVDLAKLASRLDAARIRRIECEARYYGMSFEEALVFLACQSMEREGPIHVCMTPGVFSGYGVAACGETGRYVGPRHDARVEAVSCLQCALAKPEAL